MKFLTLLLLVIAGNAFSQTVTDYDGNIYGTITIGTQTWMDENLYVAHYANGDVIPKETDGTAWSQLTTGAMCYYDNDSITHAPTHGALYNGYVAVDPRNACPTEWHVATDSDWKVLEKFVDATVDTTMLNGFTGTDVARKLKEVGPGTWLTGNSFYWGTDDYNFSALASGVRSSSDGSFGGQGNYADWWTSTAMGQTGSYAHFMFAEDNGVQRTVRSNNNGYSIRCIQDYDAALGENELDEIKLYPNPSKNYINIETGNDQPIQVEVYSISGEQVKSFIVLNHTILDLTQFKKGVYYIKSASSIQKFVKL